MTDLCLINKHCVPCAGRVPPLEASIAGKLLNELGHEWIINSDGHLYKEVLFLDFMGAITFANKIAEIAEQEAHHPDLTIAWGKCTIEIWTHKINGLTESDFILAAKIEHLK